MKRFELLLLLGLILASGLSPAQTAKAADQSSGRYLFIVETSSAMRRRADAVQETVQSLLKSDLNSQLRPGDTLGIWTFNEALYAGQFPLQTWSPEARDAVALAVGTFLKIQRYEKQSLPECLPAELERVIKASETITVLLISAGEKEIPGPLFGSEVNATFTQWTREMQRTRMPFVTVLRARKGQIIGRSVNMAPWPVTIPEFPPEPEPAAAAKTPQAPSAKQPASVPAPKPRAPLILDMSQAAKAGTTETQQAAPTATSPSTTPAPAPVEPVTSAAKTRMPEIPQPTPVQIPSAKPAASLATTAAAPSPAQPTAAPPLPSEPVEEPKAGRVQPAAPPAPVTAPQSQTATVVPPPPPAPVSVSKPEPPAAVVPPPAEKKFDATEAGTPTATGAPGAATATAVLQEPTPPAAPTPPVQTAVTVPAERFFTGKVMIVAGAIVLGGIVLLLVLSLRRRRTTAHASLITRSMDRKQD